ncbi:exonuclease subunit SbcC [Halomonas shantousis]
MKILAIRLKNLASLAGEHELDFATGPLQESGLFAITGPTGAGKSTLLDALCLALFGNTPRLRGAPTRDSQTPDVGEENLVTADPRTLLRRGTATGFAEVDFVGRDGGAYRARWSVRRARGKADGRLQASEQALIVLPEERVLASQKREFDRLLPDKLGLTFDQFTRAVMLAQSEFSAFLKADDNDRSDLLEKLTDTGIYSRISIAAYQRARQASDEIKRLESRIGGEAPATAEARQALESAVEQSEQAWHAVQAEADALKARRAWLEQDRQLRDSWQQAVAARQQAENEHAALAASRTRLARLEALAPQAHRFHQQRELEHALAELLAQQATTRRALDQAQQQQQAHQAAFDEARQQATLAQQQRQQAQPRLDEAGRHAQRLDYLTQEIEALTRERRELEHGVQSVQQALDAKHDAQACQQAELATLESRLGEHDAPERYRQTLQQTQDRAHERLMALEEARHAWQQESRLRRQQAELESRQRADLQARDNVIQEGRHAKRRLEQAQLHDRQLRDSLERLRAVRSESVEKLRAQLADHAPCPVCGSLEHPYRSQPPPSPAQELLEQTEREEQRQLEEATRQLDTARDSHQELTARYKALKTQLAQREAPLDEATRTAADARQALEALPAGRELLALDEAQRHAWLDEQLTATRHQRDEQRQRLQQFERDQQRQAPLREALAAFAVDIGKLDSQLQQQQQRLGQLDATLAPKTAEQQSLRDTLTRQLAGHADVTQWREALDTGVEKAERQLSRTRDALDTVRQEYQRLTLQLQHDRESEAEYRRNLETQASILQSWRDAHPDIDDDTLAQLLRLDDAAQADLRRQIQQADQNLRDSQLREQERLTALNDHRRIRLEAEWLDDPAACESRIEALAQALHGEEADLAPRQQRTQQQRDDALHALRDDDRRRRTLRALQTELDAANAEYRRWGKLASLIGSADGKAFRRIAQAYNLERLLEHANAHLVGLSRRYRLVRGGSPLGLLVIDTDMGDEQRSVHSLSGGETFLVSLALALGLASMASGRLKIESLFIDEGFGSLDPQSLALAMDALDGLQAQGRKVGVISHVQEMHERIPVRICVEPAGNGASRIRLDAH